MQCDPTCSNYHPCISACPPDTCENLMHPLKSERLCNDDVCVEGCKLKECPVGHVYSNGSYSECVPKASCKPVCLQESGVTYFDGDVMASDACHTCKCTRGSKVCTGLPCATDMPDVSFDATKARISIFQLFFPSGERSRHRMHHRMVGVDQSRRSRPEQRQVKLLQRGRH